MTTPKMNLALSELFDVELTSTDMSISEMATIAKLKDTQSLEQQRKYVRENLTKLIESGMTSVETMTSIAKSTENAKDFQAVALLIKTVIDANVTLLNCEVAHKPVVEAPTSNKPDGTPQEEGNSDEIIFTGSTADFLKNIRKTIDV